MNPLHERVKQAVDARLEGLIADGRVLAKVKAADIGLFASGCVMFSAAFRPLFLTLARSWLSNELAAFC